MLRCIDSVMKYCPACPYGIVHYSDDFDTEFFDYCCMYGFEFDEPTDEELKEYEEWLKSQKNI